MAAVCRSSKQHKGQGRVNYGSGKGRKGSTKWVSLEHESGCKEEENYGSGKGRKGSTKWVSLEHESGCEEEEKELPMFQIGGGSSKPIKVFVRVNGVRLPMEVDTGAAVSIISRDMKEKYFPSTPLQMSRVVLCTYTNERMGVVGELNVEVGDKGQEKKLKLYVVEQEGPTLFGRNWLEQIQLDWKAIRWASAESHEDVKPLIDKYNNVFSDELGAITGFEAHLEVKPQATPVFCKARPIPFSLKPQVDQELDRLVDVGILKKVS